MPGKLPCRRQLLSAGHRSGAAFARRCRHRHLARSLRRPDALSFGGEGQFARPFGASDRRAQGVLGNDGLDPRCLERAAVPAAHLTRVLRFFPPTCTIPRGALRPWRKRILVAQKRRLFPRSLSIQTSSKRTTGGFNIPVGWARRELERRAVNRLEPLRGFQHPRSSSSGVRAKRACPCLELKA